MEHEKAVGILKQWGFIPAGISGGWSSPMGKTIQEFIDKFPAGGIKHLMFFGDPIKAKHIISGTVRELLVRDKIQNRVALVNIPTMMLTPQWEVFATEAKIDTADLIVFEEIGLVKHSPEQILKLYSVLSTRITDPQKHFIFTSANDPDEIAANLGKAIMDYIAGTSYLMKVE